MGKLNLKRIASKVARGEYVSDSEVRELKENDPELLSTSKYMNIERKRIENEVTHAKTRKRAKEIFAVERQGAISLAMANTSTDDGGTTGMVMVESINKAEENSETAIRKIDREETEALIEKEKMKKKKINKLV